MTSISLPYSRKRIHNPEFRDSSESESEDEAPPVKLKKQDTGNKLPVAFAARLRNLVFWITGLPVKDYFSMAIKTGCTLPEEQEEDMDADEDIITIDEEENGEEKINPFLQRYRQSKKQLLANMGRLGSSSDVNGSSCTTRLRKREKEVSCMYDSRFDSCESANSRTSLQNTSGGYNQRARQGSTIVSNPVSDFEILLGTKPNTEPDEVQIISEPPSVCQSSRPIRALARSSTARNSTPVPGPSSQRLSKSQSAAYTAHEVVRLQEKEEYKLLLQKYIEENKYNYISRKSQQEDAPGPEARSFQIEGAHFKKEILQQPVNNFLEKYCKPCQLVKPASKEPKQQPVEIIIDDEDDELEILDVKLPKHNPQLISDDFFSPAWIKELKTSVQAQTEERMKIVEEHEKQLERIKKGRFLEILRIEEPAEPEFPELTSEMEEMVDKALVGDPEERLCKDIHRKDIETLGGLSWLNDLVINSYFDLIVERSKGEDYPSVHAYNTFFYSTYKLKGYAHVRRWTRKIDIFSFDLNFIPIHLGVHWCLGVIDHRSKRICYYDSMGSGEDRCLDLLHEYLCLEHKDKKGVLLEPGAYTTEAMKDIPQQMNGSDCGMFTLKYAEYISRNTQITFSQKDMHYFRRRMVYELITSKLF